MKSGHVPDEPAAQLAHFALGDADSSVEQRGPDVLPLLLPEETSQSREHHHVIADVGLGEQGFAQAGGSPYDPGSRGPSTFGGADVDGLSRIERTVSQRAARPWRRLLHEHGAAASRAPARRLGNVQRHRAGATKALLTAFAHRIDPGSHRRERRELGGAVFFPGTNRCSS